MGSPGVTIRGSPLESIQVAELLHGTGSWANMQLVVRSAIKGLLDGLAEQQESIASLQHTVTSLRRQQDQHEQHQQQQEQEQRQRQQEQWATGEASSALSSLRTEVAGVEATLRAEVKDVRERLAKKASKDDLVVVAGDRSSAAELREVRSTVSRLGSSVSASQQRTVQHLADRTRALEQGVDKTLASVYRRLDGCESRLLKLNLEETHARIEAVQGQCKLDLEHFRVALEGKASSGSVAELDRSVHAALDLKANKASVASALHRKANKGDPRLEQDLESLKEQAEQSIKTHQALSSALQAVAGRVEACLPRASTPTTVEQMISTAVSPLKRKLHTLEEAVGGVEKACDKQVESVRRVESGFSERADVLSAQMEVVAERVLSLDDLECLEPRMQALEPLEPRVEELQAIVQRGFDKFDRRLTTVEGRWQGLVAGATGGATTPPVAHGAAYGGGGAAGEVPGEGDEESTAVAAAAGGGAAAAGAQAADRRWQTQQRQQQEQPESAFSPSHQVFSTQPLTQGTLTPDHRQHQQQQEHAGPSSPLHPLVQGAALRGGGREGTAGPGPSAFAATFLSVSSPRTHSSEQQQQQQQQQRRQQERQKEGTLRHQSSDSLSATLAQQLHSGEQYEVDFVGLADDHDDGRGGYNGGGRTTARGLGAGTTNAWSSRREELEHLRQSKDRLKGQVMASIERDVRPRP